MGRSEVTDQQGKPAGRLLASSQRSAIALLGGSSRAAQRLANHATSRLVPFNAMCNVTGATMRCVRK